MNITIVIVLCVLIALVLIFFPLYISRKAEKASKQDEWEKIRNYGNKINKKTREKIK